VFLHPFLKDHSSYIEKSKQHIIVFFKKSPFASQNSESNAGWETTWWQRYHFHVNYSHNLTIWPHLKTLHP